MLWSWTPADSDLTAAEQAWFELPDEVKPIYNCDYLLVTATGRCGDHPHRGQTGDVLCLSEGPAPLG